MGRAHALGGVQAWTGDGGARLERRGVDFKFCNLHTDEKGDQRVELRPDADVAAPDHQGALARPVPDHDPPAARLRHDAYALQAAGCGQFFQHGLVDSRRLCRHRMSPESDRYGGYATKYLLFGCQFTTA
ncbi:hypothetical protein D3C81_1847720 [compost metagenome]